MAGKVKGLINRIIIGSEKSEGYARASLPSNRWELFWDILKGRFGKLIVINLLTVLFFIPLFALLFFRSVMLTGYGAVCPFGAGFGVGYQAAESLAGFAESINVNVNMYAYLLMPVALAIAAVGISGGAYVIRNMVWTEGIFVANDFWRGIKQNYREILFICLIYSVIFYASMMSVAIAEQMIATGKGTLWLLGLSEGVTYVILAFFTIMAFHMITMCVTYKLKFHQLIRNTFLFTVGLLPQNVFFFFIGIIPMLITLFGGVIALIGYILLIFFSVSFFLLVWTDYSQWIYDKINDKVPGAQKHRGIYEKVKESDSEALKKYRQQLAATSRSTLNSRPIKPITDDELKLAELPTSFRREDIEKLNASRQAIYEDNLRYIEEHKNDPEFQKTEEEIEMEKREEERAKRIEKAKKELKKRNK